jgi:hypothetical protein
LQVNSPWSPNSKLYVEHNTSGGNFQFYRPDQNPTLAVHPSGRLYYVEPSQALVVRHGLMFQQLATVITPVNIYGEKFSKDLLRTTQLMMELVDEDPAIREMVVKAYENHSSVLSHHAARVKMAASELTSPQFDLGGKASRC